MLHYIPKSVKDYEISADEARSNMELFSEVLITGKEDQVKAVFHKVKGASLQGRMFVDISLNDFDVALYCVHRLRNLGFEVSGLNTINDNHLFQVAWLKGVM